MNDSAGQLVDDEAASVDDDYYAFLSIPRNATSDEIVAAFRRMSRLYHPDKHTDEAAKKEAQELFNKIKKAYDVLIDPQRRAIYDTLGTRGLEADGWSLVERTKTADEIRQEYERLVKERDERRLQQRTNPKGVVQVGIDATDLFDSHSHDDFSLGIPRLEISSMVIQQSIDAPVTGKDTVTLRGQMTTRNGVGHGSIGVGLRHVLSARTWTELEFTAGQGPVITIKGFRTLTSKTFTNVQAVCHFSHEGIRPGLEVVLARQLDKRLVGSLTWKTGLQSAMNTTMAWEGQRGQVNASVQLGIPNSFVSLSYHHKLQDENQTRLKLGLKLGTFGLLIDYGAETKLSQHSVVGAGITLGWPTGVTVKLAVRRANQNYVFPVQLSDQLHPAAVFYGTVVPVVTYYCVKNLVIDPYNRRQADQEKAKHRAANAQRTAERRKEAETAVRLMAETYKRIVDRETAKQGLVIGKAVYGSASAIDELVSSGVIGDHDLGNGPQLGDQIPDNHHDRDDLVDVTVQMQCLVGNDSTLLLANSSKAQVNGFYDPCFGDKKKLVVRYRFRDRLHQLVVDDDELIKIPSEEHLIPT